MGAVLSGYTAVQQRRVAVDEPLQFSMLLASKMRTTPARRTTFDISVNAAVTSGTMLLLTRTHSS